MLLFLFIASVSTTQSYSQESRFQPGWMHSELLNKSIWFSPESISWKWDTILCFDEQEILLERYTQTFDISGHILTQMIQKYQGGAWVDLNRISYTNDIQGKPVTVITEQWIGGVWYKVSRLTITYDNSGRIIMEFMEKWQNEAWTDYVRRSYSYYEGNKKLGMLQEVSSGGIWENDLRTTYTYETGSNNYIVVGEFSDSGGPWEPGSKLSYTCDENGNWLEMLFEEWQTSYWAVLGKIVYINDTQGNILTETFINWLGDTWVNDSRKNYVYDIYGNALSGLNEQWQNGTWQPDMQSSYLYNKREFLCVLNIPVYRYEATYRSFASGVGDMTESGKFFTVYPNPAKTFVNIVLENYCNDKPGLVFTDISGKTVKTGILGQNNVQIDLSDLAEGIYSVTVKTKNWSETKKLSIHK